MFAMHLLCYSQYSFKYVLFIATIARCALFAIATQHGVCIATIIHYSVSFKCEFCVMISNWELCVGVR